MRKITLAQYHEEAKARLEGVPSPRGPHVASVCPICHTVQSIQDFLALGIAKDFDEAQNWAHFSCIGRFTNAGPVRDKNKSQIGCDWTLGGLLQIAELFVITPDGERPRFELATPEQTLAHSKLTDEQRRAHFRLKAMELKHSNCKPK